jgi:hypothetical protein
MKSHLKSLASGMLALSCSTGTPCPTNPAPKCEEQVMAAPSPAPAAQSEYDRLKAEDAALDDKFYELKREDGKMAKACAEAHDECAMRVVRTFQRLINEKIVRTCKHNFPDMRQFYACAVKELEDAGRQNELQEFLRIGNPCTQVLIDCMENLHALKEDPRIAGLTLDDVTVSEETADWQLDENGRSPVLDKQMQDRSPLPLPIRSYIDIYLCGVDHPAVKPCWEETNLMLDKIRAAHSKEISSCFTKPPDEIRSLGRHTEPECTKYVLKKYPKEEKAYEHQRALCDALSDECKKRVMEAME